MKIKLSVLLTALLVALLIAGCGDEKQSDSDNGSATVEQTADTGGAEESDSSEEVEEGKPPKVSGSLKEKPEIETPEGSPPEELIVKDIKKGSGKAADDGDSLKMQYVGLNWSNGVEFDASWQRGEAFPFELGAGNVIQGWDQGIKGMREGGRRLLVIPPDLGYGAAGSPPTIPPNETLVFVVDLESVD